MNTPFLCTLFQFWEILFAWSYEARNLKIPLISFIVVATVSCSY